MDSFKKKLDATLEKHGVKREELTPVKEEV